MDSARRVEAARTTKENLSSRGTQYVVAQNSDLARGLYATKQYDQNQNESGLKVSSLEQENFFQKPCIGITANKVVGLPQEIWNNILLNTSLKQILMLRLISKMWLALIEGTNFLSNQASIIFQYNQLYPNIDKSTSLKLSFAKKNNIESSIAISIDEFLKSSEISRSIPENKLKIILLIKDLRNLQQLQGILGKDSYPKFFDKIKEINMKDLEVDSGSVNLINNLLNNISNNANLLNSLSSLVFGKICTNITLTFPKEMNMLKKLTFGNIDPYNTITLPSEANDLKVLVIQNLHVDCTLHLPTYLPSLERLSIGKICAQVKLKLPTSCEKLVHFSIAQIEEKFDLVLPKSFNNIRTLSIGDIGHNSTIDLSGVKELTSLAIGKTSYGVKVNLPKVFDKLRIFSLGEVQESPVFRNTSFPCLIKFIIKKINPGYFGLPNGMNALTTLVIENMHAANLTIPILNKLKTLIIGNMNEGSSIQFPDLLPELTFFKIYFVGSRATMKLPKELKNLKTLSIGEINNKILLKQLEDLSQKLSISPQFFKK